MKRAPWNWSKATWALMGTLSADVMGAIGLLVFAVACAMWCVEAAEYTYGVACGAIPF